MNRDRMTPRERALYDVQMHAFAAKDAQLYLDTHENDRQAMGELARQTRLTQEATQRYERQFGPLTVSAAANGERYRWVENPWPWEGDA